MALERETRFALEMKDDLLTVPGLSAKEIKRLRFNIIHHKWICALFGFTALVYLCGVAAKLYQLHLLVPYTKWKRVFEFALGQRFRDDRMYSGLAIHAASLAEQAILYLLAAGIVIGAYFVIRSIRRRDILLLQYIDRDKSA